MARVTLQTVADRVGVSRMTVSNAFSRPDQLSEALRERILATAHELGYAGPDPVARALARGTTGAVGVLLTSDDLPYAFTDDVAVRFLGAIAEGLAPTGLALTLVPSTTHGGVVPARDVALDGALVYSCDPDTTAVDWLVRRGLPLVFVDQEPVDGFPLVTVDDRSGARAATEHLLALGHRRFAVLTAGLGGHHGRVDDVDAELGRWNRVSRERLLGCRDALSPVGLAPVVVRQPDNSDVEAHTVALGLLSAGDRPTAVLCYSDVVASGVLQAAEELGLAVPGDLSVVGFDDSPVALRVRPQLTTVRQDVTAKGAAAAAALTAALAARRDGRTLPVEHVVLPTELVVRGSTGPAPGRR